MSESIFDGVGSNIASSTVAFGGLATDSLGLNDSYVPDEEVIAEFDATPKKDLNTPWYTKTGNSVKGFFSSIGGFAEGMLTRVIIILAIVLIGYMLLRKEIEGK